MSGIPIGITSSTLDKNAKKLFNGIWCLQLYKFFLQLPWKQTHLKTFLMCPHLVFSSLIDVTYLGIDHVSIPNANKIPNTLFELNHLLIYPSMHLLHSVVV